MLKACEILREVLLEQLAEGGRLMEQASQRPSARRARHSAAATMAAASETQGRRLMMDWSHLIVDPLRLLLAQLELFIPKAFGALLILGVGWTIANLFRMVMVRVLRAIGLERLAEKAKLSEALHRGAIRLTVVELLG
ncbi:MAG TPA: hypothetical protein DD714_03855, partial [Candidatus Omnitrophica bacterium]|nr:hypothetical protein [Candidatus Omnitrophota bacterium]